MTQLEKNKAELWKGIEQLADQPVNHSNGSMLVAYMKMYNAYCKVSCLRKGVVSSAVEGGEAHHFDREMAMEWVTAMKNVDKTLAPHWTMEKTTELMKQYGVSADPVEFWVVMNSLYSDYCEALRRSKAATEETYVYMAQAWIDDADAVPDKAAAYYTNIVKH